MQPVAVGKMFPDRRTMADGALQEREESEGEWRQAQEEPSAEGSQFLFPAPLRTQNTEEDVPSRDDRVHEDADLLRKDHHDAGRHGDDRPSIEESVDHVEGKEQDADVEIEMQRIAQNGGMNGEEERHEHDFDVFGLREEEEDDLTKREDGQIAQEKTETVEEDHVAVVEVLGDGEETEVCARGMRQAEEILDAERFGPRRRPQETLKEPMPVPDLHEIDVREEDDVEEKQRDPVEPHPPSPIEIPDVFFLCTDEWDVERRHAELSRTLGHTAPRYNHP